MDITASVPESRWEAGDGIGSGVGDGVETSTGSEGSSGVVSGVWRPTGLSGKRRVPLLGLGSRPSESQTML